MSIRGRLSAIERRLPQPLTGKQRGALLALAAYIGDDADMLRRRSRLMELAALIRERRTRRGMLA